MYKEYITQKEFKILLENSPSNARFVVYYVSEGRRVKAMKPKKKNTVNERIVRLETKVDQLGNKVDKLGHRIDQISLTVDKLSATVNKLVVVVDKLVIAVDNLTKRVDRIEARLDYNGLKDLPKNYKY